MCGLVVLARWSERASEMAMRGALACLAHRGPDAEGTHVAWDGRLLLGHRRLAILDTNTAASQPMIDPLTGTALVFNGAIYNYRELRRELQALGAVFSTNSDTEVILQGWRFWGTECFRRFNGMWALAIHDGPSGRLYLCRDRLGVKPMYLRRSADCLAVASELKAVLAASQAPVRIDSAAALDYLSMGLLDHRPSSFLQDIVEVPPGSLWCVAPDGFTEQRRFHDWPEVDPDLQCSAVARALPELLVDAVGLRLRSDVSLAAQLSGGMDSGSVAWAIGQQREALEHFQGFFSYGYDSEAAREHDETEAALRTLEYVAPGLAFRRISAAACPDLAELEQLIAVQELPVATPSILAGWRLFRAIAASGAKVVLTGDGSDEIFAGYTRRYLPLALRRALGQLEFGQAGALLASDELSYATALRRLVWNLPSPVLTHLLRKQSHMRVIREDFFNAERVTLQGVIRLQRQGIDAQGVDDVRRVLLPQILRYGDRNAMAWGIESRSPFLDYRIAELAMRLPASRKVGPAGGKLPLRMAMAGRLPDAVVRGHKNRGLGNAEQYQVGHMNLTELLEAPPRAASDFIDVAQLREQLRRQPGNPRLWWPVCFLLWLRWLESIPG